MCGKISPGLIPGWRGYVKFKRRQDTMLCSSLQTTSAFDLVYHKWLQWVLFILIEHNSLHRLGIILEHPSISLIDIIVIRSVQISISKGTASFGSWYCLETQDDDFDTCYILHALPIHYNTMICVNVPKSQRGIL